MNKTYKIGTGILAVMLLFTISFTGCRNSEKKEPAKETVVAPPVDNTQALQDIKQAEKIFSALPSPLESAMLIKSAGAPFDIKFLNSIDNVKKYSTTRSMALNLGIYTCDLSFASLYDKTQYIIDYMTAAKKMADGLGILEAIQKSKLDELQENINNTEVIMGIVSETFLNSNSFLADEGRPGVATIVLAGGWIEGLYIATQLIDLKDFNGNKLVGRIIDQKLSIGILLSLLETNKGTAAIDEILAQMNKLNSVFQKITINAKPIKTEIDKTTNQTILKSEVTTDMSIEVFKELLATVADIRSTFVK